MTSDHDDRLAEYVSGEMDPQERPEFEASLDAEQLAEARSLRDTVLALETTLVPEPAVPSRVAQSALAPRLAVAAAIAFAFAMGFLVRGGPSTPAPTPRVDPAPQRAEFTPPSAGTSFGRSLLAIAQVRDSARRAE